MSEDKIYYAVFTPDGDVLIKTISQSYGGARSNFASPEQWGRRQEDGCTIRRITINEVKDEEDQKQKV